MNAISLLRLEFDVAHEFLEGTIEGVTEGQAHWPPEGATPPMGANYAHVVCMEDVTVNGLLKGGAPLPASTWAGKTGISEPPPPGQPWDEWARRVKVELPALRAYASAVYAATDQLLASHEDEFLSRTIDMSAAGARPPRCPRFAGRMWAVDRTKV